MNTERTCCMIKPDGIEKKVVGRVLERLESQGYKLIAMRLLRPSRDLLEKFYADHKGKDFFEPLLKFMLSGPMLAMVFEKGNAIADLRALIGTTDPKKAAPGTLRSLWGTDGRRNLIHASDSSKSANREIALLFKKEDLTDQREG